MRVLAPALALLILAACVTAYTLRERQALDSLLSVEDDSDSEAQLTERAVNDEEEKEDSEEKRGYDQVKRELLENELTEDEATAALDKATDVILRAVDEANMDKREL